jgi:hypothetical protein
MLDYYKNGVKKCSVWTYCGVVQTPHFSSRGDIQPKETRHMSEWQLSGDTPTAYALRHVYRAAMDGPRLRTDACFCLSKYAGDIAVRQYLTLTAGG